MRATNAASQQEQRETLADLVREVLDSQSISGREFSRRAEKAGLRVSYTTINNLAHGRHTGKVSDDTIRALSIVGKVKESRVRTAAGAPLADDSTDPVILGLHRKLSPEEKTEGLRIYREFVRTMERMRGGRADGSSQEVAND